MLVLVEEFDVYLDFRAYIVHLSLGGPGDVELDETDKQVGNPKGKENSTDLESLRGFINPFKTVLDGFLVHFILQYPSKCPFCQHFL